MATSADGQGQVLADYSARPRQVRVLAKLNLRAGASRGATIVRKIDPPHTFLVDQLVEAETYLGEPRWFREAGTGHYFWAGAGEMLGNTPPPKPVAMDTPVRNGAIAPLTDAEIRAVYGDFAFSEVSGGAVRITTPGWEGANIVDFRHPVLAAAGSPQLRVHRKALQAFTAVFDAIAADTRLSGVVRTCGGTFVPRHKGWEVGRSLSSHSWGIAIDLNVAWNPYRREPAAPGSIGSVHEIVPHFAAQGFAWGGHFSSPYRDGMHFELARRDL